MLRLLIKRKMSKEVAKAFMRMKKDYINYVSNEMRRRLVRGLARIIERKSRDRGVQAFY